MLCYYPRKHLRAKKQTQNSNVKRSLKEQPENALSQCCSMKENDKTSDLKCIDKEFKKAALASGSTFSSKYHDRHFLHDFVTPDNTVVCFFLVRAFNVHFDHALHKKVPKMLCQYSRKHFRAKKQAQNCNLQTSLKTQPEKAISQFCFYVKRATNTQQECI